MRGGLILRTSCYADLRAIFGLFAIYIRYKLILVFKILSSPYTRYRSALQRHDNSLAKIHFLIDC